MGGDSRLIVFDSIDWAVRCAVKVQKQVPANDGDQPVHIGINISDAIADGADLYGDAVNVAARLQAECAPVSARSWVSVGGGFLPHIRYVG